MTTTSATSEPEWPMVDAGRLSRALHLSAEPLDEGAWLVSGGAAYHVVAADTSCDCVDYATRRTRCKHVLAVALARLDRDLLAGLRALDSGEHSGQACPSPGVTALTCPF